MVRKIASTLLTVVLLSTGAWAANIVVSGNITTNTTWTSNNTYLLNGFVYVKAGATLTIEPGTVIYGDKASKGALIIEQGAKIIADGTAAQPIVFTSALPAGQRSYGDWGGLILCGRAPINVPGGTATIEGGVGSIYGGTDPADNSGTLRYVRLEFPGIAFQPNSEINGLTLGGVGSGTIIDYVQVSYSGDDGFEFFGGTVNAKHLISLRTLDDDFDTDFGFSGKVQYAVALRDPNAADQSTSQGFETDNDATGTPKTSPIFSNVTLVGPKVNNSDVVNTLYVRAAHIRRNTEFSFYNSIVMGWPGASAGSGIYIDGNSTADNATANRLQIRNIILAGKDTVTTNATNGFNAHTWFNTAAFGNTRFATSAEVQLVDPFNLTNPNFTPRAGSPALTGADFTNTRLTDTFFTSTTFRGAFGSGERWDSGWTNYNPQGTSNSPQVAVAGNITTNTTWTSNKNYLLNGFVYVKAGATLTIEPGTVIFGDKASKGSLIVEQGAKIIADGGTADRPIIFTSALPPGQRAYGDWGGLIICGRAPINVAGGTSIIEGGVGSTYGGTDPNDDSGILRYVRIEFPGIAFQVNNEINGLTLGGVGNGTVIDYVQVSYSGDDGFEFFGGTVNAKHLISLRTLDDDFDTDFGYSGKVQYAVALRDPQAADVSTSHGFETDNDGTGTPNTPKTSAIFSNVTLVGPKVNNSDVLTTPYVRATHIRRNTEFSFYNSIVMGWPGASAGSGIYIDGNSTADNAMANRLQIRNAILAGKDTVTTNATNGFNALSWFDTPAFGNTRLTTSTAVQLANPFNLTNPDFRPLSGSPALSGADFTNTRLTDTFFTSATFRGAFGSGERWDAKWANYNPQYSVNSILSDVKVKQTTAIPTTHKLEQNYPNPFNPSTQIKYALPNSGHVTLKLYDLAGREVATLVDHFQTAGEFTVTFNAAGLATGIYFYRLNVGDYSEVKRMAFVK